MQPLHPRPSIISLLFCAFALVTACFAVQEPEILVQVDRNSVYEGEPISYSVTLNHVDQPAPPDLSGFDDFDVQPAGETNLNSQQISIVNGVRTEIIRRGKMFSYRLTPRKSGPLVIPAPRATIDGQEIEGKPLKVLVKAADSQETVKLELSVDRSTVYVSQPFTLQLTALVRALPDPNGDQDPMTVQREQPELTVSWLDDAQVPKMLKPLQSLQDVLQPLVSSRGTGFGLNGLRDNSIFAMLDRSGLTFHPKRKSVKRTDSAGQEVDYWAYEFKRTFRANSPAEYLFNPVTVKGVFGTSISRGRLQGESIFAKSNPLVVHVLDAPAEGRPDSYVGAIGKFAIVTELSPTTAHVGDPLTLVISLRGTGTLADAWPPKLESVPGISDSFKIYDSTSQSEDDAKKFTYSIRPLNSSVSQFPQIPLSYFDVESQKYVTLTTQPIALSISEAERLSGSGVVAASGTSEPNSDSQMRLADGGLFANYTDLGSLSDERVSPRNMVLIWIGMLGLAIVVHATVGWIRYRRKDPAVQRRQTALSRAESILETAAKASDAQPGTQITTIRRAVAGLVADFANLSVDGMSIGDIDEQLHRVQASEGLRTEVRDFLASCDAAKFGATQQESPISIKQARRLLNELNRTLTQSVTAVLLLVVLGMTAGCSSSPDTKNAEQFLQASQLFESAKTSQEYFNAAIGYQQILDSGMVSGPVLFNQGNAWMKAGEPGRAIASYRQAERLRPRDTQIKANLKTALASTSTTPSSDRSPIVYLYFWKDWLSIREKVLLATAVWGGCLLASCLAWNWSPARNIAAVLFGVTVVFGAGCCADFVDQYATRHGVIVAGPVDARKGNGEDYSKAFTNQLNVGCEFVVLDNKLGWLQIELDGVGQGWVPENTAVLY